LGDVAEYIAEIYRPGQCSIEIKIDFETIASLFLNVSMNTIRQAILDYRKLKLKPDMVTIGGKARNKIIILLSETAKHNLYQTIQHLKHLLPGTHKRLKFFQKNFIESQNKNEKREILFIDEICGCVCLCRSDCVGCSNSESSCD
jgi:hypothetical protein